MKSLIAITALAVSFACPVWAEKWTRPMVAHCTNDFNDVTDIYGDLTEVTSRVSGVGFGISLMESDVFEVMIVFPPDGAICVIWDNALIEGDPA